MNLIKFVQYSRYGKIPLFLSGLRRGRKPNNYNCLTSREILDITKQTIGNP